MKKLLCISFSLLSLLLGGALTARAQEDMRVLPEVPKPLYYVDHPHSITLSTGFPFIFAMMYPPGSGDNGWTMDGWKTGIKYKTWTATNLNVGYNYQINKRWEVSFLITVCGYVYSRYAYPQKGEDQYGNPQYDWNATPENQGVHYDLRGIMPAVMARYYWLARKSAFQMYSATGIAYIPSSSLPVFPTLTPVGIRFGSGHWYGVAELTFGTTATLLLAGAGYRF